jgi:hypothetical protein
MLFALCTVTKTVTLFLTQVHLFSHVMQSIYNPNVDFLGTFLISVKEVFPFVWMYSVM